MVAHKLIPGPWHQCPWGLTLSQQIQAIQTTTIKGLLEFVGMVNFYNRFLPKAAPIMLFLYQAIGETQVHQNTSVDTSYDRNLLSG